MNKKGISAVVTTVLIILLSIIAVIILWAAIRPMIEDTSGKAGTAVQCAEISVNIESCTLNPTTNMYNVVVARSGGSGNVNVIAAVSDAVKSNSSSANDIGPLDTRTISIDNTNTGLVAPVKAQAAVVLSDGTVCTAVKADCS